MSALTGRIALVTGASRGIGAATAWALRDAGATVVRLARSLTSGSESGYHDVRCDLTDSRAVPALLTRVLDTVGVPDIVVSNAGAFLLSEVESTTCEAFESQWAINLCAPFLVARSLLPAMRGKKCGRYITIGSISDHRAFGGNAAYAAAKFGLRGLHEVLREEYRSSGVLFTLVSPGPVDTAVWDPVDPDHRPGFLPRHAMLHPGDVAETVLYVASRPPRVDIDWIRMGPSGLSAPEPQS